MKISHRWLKDYIRFRLSPAELSDKLSMLGLEVGSYEDMAAKYDKILVGKVLTKTKHPNADRLVLCTVDTGKEILEIVCGAPNVAAGQKVAVALVGARIPRNQHDPDGKPFVLERAMIRGIESNGMICSAYELGLGEDADGILVLDDKARTGTSLARYLGATDIVYEMEVTANRGDWMSHIGVAREMQGFAKAEASLPRVKIRESKTEARRVATIKILDSRKCLRYSSRILRNITVGPSPKWLQDRLSAVDIRPVNNVVDVTNYVMMETGQPLHAFDFDLLSGHAIVVRCAEEGEGFTTLDGKARTLNSEILMICDGSRPVAIAGVMGGANSEISNKTTSVLIESANFDPGSVRRAAKIIGLSTDASQRFERGVDIEMTAYAANRVAQLLQSLSGAEVLKGVIDVYPKKPGRRTIKLRIDRANRILGTSLTLDHMVALLKRLRIKPVLRTRGGVVLEVPSSRKDLVEEIDVIEEVARIYGYDKIAAKTNATVDFSKPRQVESLQDELRDYLVGAGFSEMLTLSLQDSLSGNLMGGKAVEVLNPVSAEASVLRASLIPGALQSVKHNRSHGEKNLRCFELGNVFSLREGFSKSTLEGFDEEERILLLLAGEISRPQYGIQGRKADIFDLKGEIAALLSKFHLDKYRFISYDNAGALIETALAVEINGTYTGFLGKITRSLAIRFGIEDDVFISELKTKVIDQNRVVEKKYRTLPRFPRVTRDLSFVVDASLPQERVEEAIKKSGGSLLSGVTLFDLYVGDRIGPGKKSLAFTLELQPMDRTLTDSEADELIGRIVVHVQAECHAKLRSL